MSISPTPLVTPGNVAAPVADTEADEVKLAVARKLRQQRGTALAAVVKIVPKGYSSWIVPSATGVGEYVVTINGPDPNAPLCTCEDHATTGVECKHAFAVAAFLKNRHQPAANPPTPKRALKLLEKAKAKRPTYPQDWPAYNKAQTQEKQQFQILLAELCAGIFEPPQEIGRPRVSLRDAVFSAVFKVYSGFSGRRFMSDLRDAHGKGHVGHPMHYNTVSKYMEMKSMTPILTAMIVESSMPLRSIETDFAADSSGFSTSRFVRWIDHKYGKPVAEYDWVKVSIMTGVKTNIVTSVKVDEKCGHDSPQFIPLLAETAEKFTIKEVSADAAYASYDNMEAVAAAGGTPFIAYKANATGREGGVYAQMFHYYVFHRAEFLEHYHKRSNVETTFSMMKAKMGDSLRAKSDTAMVNEALAKVLAHNLCCLIQSTYELGVNVMFWGDEGEVTEPKARSIPPDFMPIEAYAWM